MTRAKETWIKRALLIAASLVVLGGLVYALIPAAVPVDTAVISRGQLLITVDEEGKSRIKDVYVVSSPIAGRLHRSELTTGDSVKVNETVIAEIEPAVPPFMDLRTTREVDAQIKSAEAGVQLAAAEVQQARADVNFAESEFARATQLLKSRVIPERNVEKAQTELNRLKAALARAEAAELVRRRELERAMAQRIGPDDAALSLHGQSCCLVVRAPVSGRVLSIVQESEQVVAQGTPLVEIGDPGNLEIIVDLLSADAVRLSPGAAATIEGWGGEPVAAKVDRINPAGFTKVSALGIEEQRVRVVLDPQAAPDILKRLGHDYRVFVRITLEEKNDALLVPLGALFRKGELWAVYVFEDGLATVRTVELGSRNTTHAEVIGGLKEGTRVILHPSDRVVDGGRVAERQPGG